MASGFKFAANVTVSGYLAANVFVGDGSRIVAPSLTFSNVVGQANLWQVAGVVPFLTFANTVGAANAAQLSGVVPFLTFANTAGAANLAQLASAKCMLTASNVVGLVASATTDTTVAGNIATGTLLDARYGPNVAMVTAATTTFPNTLVANTLWVTGNCYIAGNSYSVKSVEFISNALVVVNAGNGPAASITQTGSGQQALVVTDNGFTSIYAAQQQLILGGATQQGSNLISMWGSVGVSNGLSVQGNVACSGYVQGNGAFLTGLPSSSLDPTNLVVVAGNVVIGPGAATVANYRLNIVGDVAFTGNLYQKGNVYVPGQYVTTWAANLFYSGSVGTVGNMYVINSTGGNVVLSALAPSLTFANVTGTIADAQLSANVFNLGNASVTCVGNLTVAGNLMVAAPLRVNTFPCEYIYGSGSGTMGSSYISAGQPCYYDRTTPIPLPTGVWIELLLYGTNQGTTNGFGIKFDPYISEISNFATLNSTYVNCMDVSYQASMPTTSPLSSSNALETQDYYSGTPYGILLNWVVTTATSGTWTARLAWFNTAALNNSVMLPIQTDTTCISYTGGLPMRQYGVAGVATLTPYSTTTVTGFRLLVALTGGSIGSPAMTYNYRIRVVQ